jgi:hypothetical protein
MQNVVQNAQTRSIYNLKVAITPLAWRKMEFSKHDAKGVGEIIVQGSPWLRIIADLGSLVNETRVSSTHRE